MNKKITLVTMIFMFFLSTCAVFADVVPVQIYVSPAIGGVKEKEEVAQRHHRHYRHEAPPPRYHKCKCPPDCRCIRHGNCRPGHCVRNCRCQQHNHRDAHNHNNHHHHRI